MPKSSQSLCLVLLAEDEAIVAMNLQDELKEAGYTVVGPFDTCAGAMDWLESQTPDLAVLDTVLKDGSCKALAAELTRRGVGLVLWSGHPQDKHTLQDFRDAIWVKKPSTHAPPFDALASLTNEPQRQQA